MQQATPPQIDQKTEPAPVDRLALRQGIEDHLRDLGLWNKSADDDLTKQAIREIHREHRESARQKIVKALGKERIHQFINLHIANGDEIDADSIEPELHLVESESDARIFRFATLNWSIPASMGYGRRIRYLVKDKQNDKLIGVFALCDPVFNLNSRDEWAGWDQAGRRERLVHTMSAYVTGALPPYSQLLGGKLVTALVASREVGDAFKRKYRYAKGHISQRNKNPKLVLVTFTSALGKSSIYNRLKLYNNNRENPAVVLHKIGFTRGFGHFQIREEHFKQFQQILDEDGYHNPSPKMGTGPNWKIRVAREGLARIGFEDVNSILRHGIKREVFLMPIADNAKEFLSGKDTVPSFDCQHDVSEISEMCKDRWIVPRAARTEKAYMDYRKEDAVSFLQL